MNITSELSRLLAMTKLAIPSGKIEEQLKERVRSCKCLLCTDTPFRRGLCYRHYRLFLRTMTAKPMRLRAKFQAQLIAAGKLLAAGVVRQLRTDNPFE